MRNFWQFGSATRDAGVVEQFNSVGVIEICLRLTLVATVTKISDFQHKISHKSA